MKRIISIALCMIMMLSVIPPVFADGVPTVILNGEPVSLATAPICDDGVWMVPFKEVMEIIGIPIDIEKGTGEYIGKIGDIEIGVRPNKKIACWDFIPFDTERVCKSVENDVMVEAQFFKKVYNSKVSISDAEIRISIEIPQKDEDDVLDVDAYLAGIESTEVFRPEQIFEMQARDSKLLTQKVIDVEGMPFDKALQVHSNEKRDLSYEIQVSMTSDQHLYIDDVCVITLYARCERTQHESNNAFFTVVHEQKDTWIKFLTPGDLIAGADGWTRFQVVYRISEELPPGNHQINFVVGYYNQDVQFGGLSVRNYGQRIDHTILPLGTVGGHKEGIYQKSHTDYYGREEGALWREEAFKRIEKNRVRDIIVNVKDENGNPIEGAKAAADMTRSEFAWGTMVATGPLLDWSTDSNHYAGEIKRLFNCISEGNQLKYSASDEISAARSSNFAEKNNMYNRLHNIVWDDLRFLKYGGSPIPDRAVDWKITDESSEEELLEKFASHASWILSNFGDTYDEIDVVNEPIVWTEFAGRYGQQWMADVIKIVHDMVPDKRLFINDFGIDGYYGQNGKAEILRRIVNELKALGAPIDGVGLECHETYLTYPQILYDQMDIVSEDVDYITVTEWDMQIDTDDNLAEIQAQAEFLRDFITIVYSHPKTVGFHLWGFTDQNHNKSNGPFYDYNYNPRPALKYWEDLVLGEWFTHTSNVTDAGGRAAMRGHRGEYNITVEANGMSAATTLKVTDKGVNTVDAVVTSNGITLTSSELVPVNEYKEIPPDKVRYTWDDATQLYRKMYENKTSSVIGANGENLDFLKEKESAAVHKIDAGQSIIAKVDEPMESGFVKVTMQPVEDKSFIYQIDGRLDGGEWISLGRSDSLSPKYIPFGTKINQIRISGIDGREVWLSGVHISEKEWVR